MKHTRNVSRIMLILGAIALTCTPAALAISGTSYSNRTAAAAQYPPPGQTPGPNVTATATPTIEVSPTATAGTPETSPTAGGGTPTPPTTTTTQQGTTPAARSPLPFTGGPVLPLLLAAFVLLGVGAVLRRAGNDSASD